MQFEFATAGRIVFGRGAAKPLAKLVAAFGQRPLLVTGRRKPSVEIKATRFVVAGEPTTDLVQEGVRTYLSADCDCVVSIGGGSVIDAGKAIAALVTNGGDLFDYLEVIGAGKPLSQAPAPFIAVPTTAGTGSEVTRNAVLGSPQHRVKVSLRSLLMLPRLAIVDPDLTRDLPAAITGSAGMDALTQVIEPFVSSRANDFVDGYCLEGIKRAARSLRRASAEDMDAREDMSFASLLGGLSLANAGLGVVHGFASPIGGMFDAPHGAICAAILPHGMAANIKALRTRAAEHPSLARYGVIAKLLSGDERPDAAVMWVQDLCSKLQVPRLSTYGITHEHVDELCEKAAKASSMKANPIELTPEELQGTLAASL